MSWKALPAKSSISRGISALGSQSNHRLDDDVSPEALPYNSSASLPTQMSSRSRNGPVMKSVPPKIATLRQVGDDNLDLSDSDPAQEDYWREVLLQIPRNSRAENERRSTLDPSDSSRREGDLEIAARILPSVRRSTTGNARDIYDKTALDEFDPFDSEMMIQSEALIEKQRSRIGFLKEELEKADRLKEEDIGKLRLELREAKENNAKLRLEIDLLKGELIVRGDEDQGNFVTEAKLRQANLLKEKKIKDLNNHIEQSKGTEEELLNLRKENTQMKMMLEQSSSHRWDGGQPLSKAQQEIRNLKGEIQRNEQLLQSLRVRQDEARLATLSAVDSEHELVEAKETIRYQKKMLDKLQRALEIANREKALVPPTMLIIRNRKDLDKIGWMKDRVLDIYKKEDPEQNEVLDCARIESLFAEQMEKINNLVMERRNEEEEKENKEATTTEPDYFYDLKRSELDVDNLVEEIASFRIKHKCIMLEQLGSEEEVLSRVANDLKSDVDWPFAAKYNKFITLSPSRIAIYETLEKTLAPNKIAYVVDVETIEGARVKTESPFLVILPVQKQTGFETHIMMAQSLAAVHKIERLLRVTNFKGRNEKILEELVADRSCLTNFTSHRKPNGEIHKFVDNETVLEISKEENTVKTGDTVIDAGSTLLEIDKNCDCFKLWCFPSPEDESTHSLISFTFGINHDRKFNALINPLLALNWKNLVISEKGTFLTSPKIPTAESASASSSDFSEVDLTAKLKKTTSAKSIPSQKEKEKNTDFQQQIPSAAADPLIEEDLFDALIIENRKLYIREISEVDAIYIGTPSDCRVFIDSAANGIKIYDIKDNSRRFDFELSPDRFKAKVEALKTNGFLGEDKSEILDPELQVKKNVAVVTRGDLSMYQVYGRRDDKPFLKLRSKECQIILSEFRREVYITELKPDSEPRNIHLDCGTYDEYRNWKTALTFAGFIQSSSGETQDTIPELQLYCFPIRLLNSDELNLEYVRVVGTRLNIYESADNPNPVYSVEKELCEVSSDIKKRCIRLRANKGTPSEDRVTIVFSSIVGFDLANDSIRRGGMILNDDQANKLLLPWSSAGVIIFRAEGIRYWKSFDDYLNDKLAANTIPSAVFYAEKIDKNGVKIVARKPQFLHPDDRSEYQRLSNHVFNISYGGNTDEIPRWKFGLWVSSMNSEKIPAMKENESSMKPSYIYMFTFAYGIKASSGFFRLFGNEEQRMSVVFQKSIQRKRDLTQKALQNRRASAPTSSIGSSEGFTTLENRRASAPLSSDISTISKTFTALQPSDQGSLENNHRTKEEQASDAPMALKVYATARPAELLKPVPKVPTKPLTKIGKYSSSEAKKAFAKSGEQIIALPPPSEASNSLRSSVVASNKDGSSRSLSSLAPVRNEKRDSDQPQIEGSSAADRTDSRKLSLETLPQSGKREALMPPQNSSSLRQSETKSLAQQDSMSSRPPASIISQKSEVIALPPPPSSFETSRQTSMKNKPIPKKKKKMPPRLFKGRIPP